MSGLPSMPPGVWQSEQPAIDDNVFAAHDLRLVGQRRPGEHGTARAAAQKALRTQIATILSSSPFVRPPARRAPDIGIPVR